MPRNSEVKGTQTTQPISFPKGGIHSTKEIDFNGMGASEPLSKGLEMRTAAESASECDAQPVGEI
jgi:hypothetical protein